MNAGILALRFHTCWLSLCLLLPYHVYPITRFLDVFQSKLQTSSSNFNHLGAPPQSEAITADLISHTYTVYVRQTQSWLPIRRQRFPNLGLTLCIHYGILCSTYRWLKRERETIWEPANGEQRRHPHCTAEYLNTIPPCGSWLGLHPNADPGRQPWWLK